MTKKPVMGPFVGKKQRERIKRASIVLPTLSLVVTAALKGQKISCENKDGHSTTVPKSCMLMASTNTQESN